MDWTADLIKAFVTLFIIMDPFGCLPIFISLTKGLSKKEKHQNAYSSVFVASAIILAFLLFGIAILDYFSITLSSFKIAGGLILLLIAIMYVLGINIRTRTHPKHSEIVLGKLPDSDVSSVPVGTPLLSGPGVITTTIILADHYGRAVTFAAAAATLLLTWIILRHSDLFFRMIGSRGVNILSRLMAILLAGIAVEFIISGILQTFPLM